MTSTLGDDTQTAHSLTNPNHTLVKFVAVSIALHAALLLVNLPEKRDSNDEIMYVNLTADTPAATPEAKPEPETPKPVEPVKPAPAPEPAPEPEPITEPSEEPEPQAEAEPEPAPAEPHAEAAAEPTPPTAETSAEAAPAMPTMPSNFRSDQDIANELMGRYRQHDLYPAMARRNGWRGSLQIQATIMPDGTVTNVKILQGSGYLIFDMNATIVMSKIPQISPLAPGQEPVDIVLGVSYSPEQFPR